MTYAQRKKYTAKLLFEVAPKLKDSKLALKNTTLSRYLIAHKRTHDVADAFFQTCHYFIKK